MTNSHLSLLKQNQHVQHFAHSEETASFKFFVRLHPRFRVWELQHSETVPRCLSRQANQRSKKSNKRTKMYFKIVYVSKLKPSEEWIGREGELVETIRVKAAENNKSQNIGGVLLYNAETQDLVQLLEGDEEPVLKLYNAIAKDSRHENVRQLVAKETQERTYTEWGMLCGGSRDWKAVKTLLPKSVEGKAVATFDEAFASGPAETRPAVQKKKRKGFFACLAA